LQRDPNTVVIDHISLGVRNLAVSARFYDATLEPLGISRKYEGDDHVAYARNGLDDFSIHREASVRPSGKAHFAFLAPDRDAVDAFHRAALAAGGWDEGEPGLRPNYHPNYYAAFVLDPDGHRIEAVCHAEI
jgi:catechol 2,3-dioxygenase-like lactoylglutathione lyase family enzyme